MYYLTSTTCFDPLGHFCEYIYLDSVRETMKTLNRKVDGKTEIQIEKIQIEFVERNIYMSLLGVLIK